MCYSHRCNLFYNTSTFFHVISWQYVGILTLLRLSVGTKVAFILVLQLDVTVAIILYSLYPDSRHSVTNNKLLYKKHNLVKLFVVKITRYIMCSKQRTSQSPVRTNPTAAQRRGAARSAVSPSSKTRGCIIPLLVDAAAEIVEVS